MPHLLPAPAPGRLPPGLDPTTPTGPSAAMAMVAASDDDGGSDTPRIEPAPAHFPVMVERVLHHLAPKPGGRYLDATFGRGGHSRAILEAAASATPTPPATLLALDKDPAAAPTAAALAAEYPNFRFLRRDFADLDAALAEIGRNASGAPEDPDTPARPNLDGILLDLGLSSPQLDAPANTDAPTGRGFSFLRDEPLDMRFDPHTGETAAELLDRLDEPEIADLLHAAGERRSRAIARKIAARRPLRTTGDLRAAVIAAVGPKRRRLDPATRAFLAVRRAVNREAEALAAALDRAPARLAPGGALVVLSYHSDEDRPVKHRFRALAATGEYTVETRRPERPDEAECAKNRRARSARLRALRRNAPAPDAPR